MPTGNPFLVDNSPDPTPPQFPQGLQSNQQAIQQNSGLVSAIQSGIPNPNQIPNPVQQPPKPGTVKGMFTGFLKGMSDALKKDAGLETSAEYQQRMLQNQQHQQNLAIQQQQANTMEGYRQLQGQQYGMQTVEDADGNPIQIQAKDAGRYLASIARTKQAQQSKDASAIGALAQKGLAFTRDENGNITGTRPLTTQEQSDFLKSQQAKNQGAANQSNAHAAAYPVEAQAALARAKTSAARLDATITKQSGKVTSAVQNRAALSDNVEENIKTMEDILARRPDLFGKVDGRISKAKLIAGTDDPDILAWKQANSNIVKANQGMHQMRSKYGMEHDLPNLDFIHGPNGLAGTFSSIRKSADQFRNEPNAAASPMKPTHVYVPGKGIQAIGR